MSRKRNRTRWPYLIVFSLTLSGCFDCTKLLRQAKRERLDDVAHVVVFWLKQPGDQEARQRIIEASKSLLGIRGVRSVEAGEALRSPRANVDKTYDVAVIMWFRDQQALEEYQVDPQHQAMLKEVGPLVERVVVYDVTRAESVKK